MKKIYFIILILTIGACKERFSPKPNGYLRIDLEKKTQKKINSDLCPFSFSAPSYFNISYKSIEENHCWLDLKYPKHRATIHLTYKNINTNIFNILEESRSMVYKHTVKADQIVEKKYSNQQHNTYGTLYDIYGETASAVQFHITDSNKHFLRGALYFSVNPNQDSLKPIINYMRDDLITIMETLEWQD